MSKRPNGVTIIAVLTLLSSLTIGFFVSLGLGFGDKTLPNQTMRALRILV